MNKTVTVHVTQDDINHGIENNAVSCPIAIALNRDVPAPGGGHLGWMVDEHKAIQTYGLGGMLKFPPAARQFIEDFDGHGKGEVEPFTFRARWA